MRFDEGLHHEVHVPAALSRWDPAVQRWLDTPLGWKVRRRLSPLAELVWLAGGTPPSRIGYGTGALQALRERRQHRAARPLRLCLLEDNPPGGARFARAQAYWINRRSRACLAVVNQPEGADVVWVFSQDPLSPATRGRLERTLAELPRGTVVLNGLAGYDAYHHDTSFERLRAAGVGVPRTAFGPDDVGRTPVVYKVAGEQSCGKELAPWRGPVPGYRAFGYTDGRGRGGLHWRYRAFYAVGVVEPFNAYGSPDWEATYTTRQEVDLAFALTAEERRQIARIGEVLGLDYFAVDFLRRRTDGAPVFVDINVYPTMVGAPAVDRRLGCRGRWHVLDTRTRLGLDEPGATPFWERLDRALLARVAAARAPAAATAA